MKKHSLETFARISFMSLKYSFASTRPHRLHIKNVLPISAVNYSSSEIYPSNFDAYRTKKPAQKTYLLIACSNSIFMKLYLKANWR